MSKKEKGQFYTVASAYILDGFTGPPPGARCILEPFAGKGDLLTWVSPLSTLPVEAYDIDPKRNDILKRDTLLEPPNYENAWVLTNPPYLARNKTDKKQVFDTYDTNDLYKCFLMSLVQQKPCAGGILIIPAGFFLSPRPLDVRCRAAFMSRYQILQVRYFEETVFPDTTTTVVAIQFVLSHEEKAEQSVEWIILPSKEKRRFTMSAANNWIIGGDIYNLSVPVGVKVRRHVEGQALKKEEQMLSLTLNALDSGTQDGRICLEYKEGYVYPAKDTSRTYATLCLMGKSLSAEQQKRLSSEFNSFLEQKRVDTWSLFLPQYRESKEYARKRIPFDLAYRIVLHLIERLF
jgi:hypothetical protein